MRAAGINRIPVLPDGLVEPHGRAGVHVSVVAHVRGRRTLPRRAALGSRYDRTALSGSGRRIVFMLSLPQVPRNCERSPIVGTSKGASSDDRCSVPAPDTREAIA